MPSYEERKPGIYRARYVGWSEVEFDNEETGGKDKRWAWKFQEVADPTTAGEMTKYTGTSLKSANSNARKIATGLMGGVFESGHDTETHVGELYDVVYGPNQAGNLTITSVVRVTEDKGVPTGDIPF
jgi:hypothetical protein